MQGFQQIFIAPDTVHEVGIEFHYPDKVDLACLDGKFFC